MDKDILKQVLKDVWSNYAVPIVLGSIIFVLINTYIYDFFDAMHQYYILIGLATGGTFASLVYGIMQYFKLLKQKKQSNDK